MTPGARNAAFHPENGASCISSASAHVANPHPSAFSDASVKSFRSRKYIGAVVSGGCDPEAFRARFLGTLTGWDALRGDSPAAPQMFARTDHDHVQRAGSQKSHVGTPDGIRTGRRRKGVLAMPVNAIRDLDVAAAWGAWRQTGTGWCAEGTGPIRHVPPAFRTLQPLWRGDDERRWVSLTRRAILVETPSHIRRHRPAARLPAVAGVHSGVPGGAAGRGVSRRHRGDSRGVVGGPLNLARRTPPCVWRSLLGSRRGTKTRTLARHSTACATWRPPSGLPGGGGSVDTTSANDLLHWMA